MGEELAKNLDDLELSDEELTERLKNIINNNEVKKEFDLNKKENESLEFSDLEKALSPDELSYLMSVLDVRNGDAVTNGIIKKLRDNGVSFTMDDLVMFLNKKKEEQIGNREEFFNNLEKKISKEDMDYLLNSDLNNLGSRINYIAARVGVTNYELIELAKYRKGQLKERERLSVYDKALSKEDLEYLMGAKDVSQADYEINNILVRLRKQGIDANLNDLAAFIKYKKSGVDFSDLSNEESKDVSETVTNDDISVNKDELYKEYLDICNRLDEINNIFADCLKNNKKIPSELVEERDRLIKRKNELLPQVKDMANIKDNKPRKLSDYVEQEKSKDVGETIDEDANEIVSERDGSHLSKAKAFIEKIKNLPKVVKAAGALTSAALLAGVGYAIYSAKHGDTQQLSDIAQHVAETVKNVGAQINPDGIDPSAIGQHIDTTFVSSGDAVNSVHGLKPLEEYFQYDIQNLVDSQNHIIPANGMSYDELVELVKNGNDIASVQVGGDAAHIDGHLNINDIINAYDAATKGGVTR